MKAATLRWTRVAFGAVLIMVCGMTAARAQGSCPSSPTYSPDFQQNQSCLTLNGNNNSGYSGSPSFATPQTAQPSVSAVLRLTAAQGGWATSAWYQTPQNVANGFSTTFAFQIGNSSAYDADGLAFVIQNSSLTALGQHGCGIGFGGSNSGCAPPQGISNSVAVKFDTYLNGGLDPSNSSVSIQSCGVGGNSVDPACRLGVKDLAGTIQLADGKVHVASVTYLPSTLSNCGPGGNQTCSTLDVVVDGTDLFPGGVLFDMSQIGLTDSSAWVGFTAGTGGGNDEQDIVSWTFNPQAQSLTGTVNPGQTNPTTFKINGGFVEGSPTTGYDFTAQETDTSLTLQMVVNAIPISQKACNALVRANSKFQTAECFVFQNGATQGQDASVLFEITCPPGGSCGSGPNPFDAELGTNFSFDCAENIPLQCGPTPLPFSFGFPNLTSVDALPNVGFLKGEGPDAIHPCTPNTDGTPLFQSNQIDTFHLGDVSGGAKGGSGGTTSCWVMTYQTQNETPSITITQPVNGATFVQGQSDSTTIAKYSCSALNAGAGSPVGPYLSIASCTGTDSNGTSVASGNQIDTSTPGPHTITVQAQDSATNTNSQSVTYTVKAPATIAGPTAATFQVGTFNSVIIHATGFPLPTLSETGALPSGVTFVDNKNGTGTLSGIATVSGIFPITFMAQNGVGSPATLGFTLTAVASVPVSGTKCNGVYNGVFRGDLFVTDGQSCIFIGGGIRGDITQVGGYLALSNTSVGGDVEIHRGGTFSIGPSTTIRGDLEIESVSGGQDQVCGSSIGRNVEIEGIRASVLIGSGNGCPGNVISGNLLVHENAGPTSIFGNTVGRNLLDQGNRGATQVFSNHVSGNLQCSADSSITGGGNTASKKLGQCSAF